MTSTTGATSTVQPREVLGPIPVYKPGRSPADLAEELGLPDAVKLASNENPYGPLPSVLDAVGLAAAGINRYPDNGAAQLTGALASRYSLADDQIALGCGSVTVANQIVQAFAGVGDEVVHAWRSFEAYPILVAISGATGVRVPLADATHDLDAMLAAVTDRTKVVLVCNPNNPTGTAVREAELTAFLDAVPQRVLVVLDEAYTEFVRDPEVPDGLALMRGRPNVCVLRTFSKAYGLAGLRVGWMAAEDPAVAAAVRKTYMPFSVSSVAQAAAVASLGAADELAERVARVVAERDRVAEALAGRGYDVPRSEANFVWLGLGGDTQPTAERLEKQGVITRAFGDEGIRVTIGTPEENDVLLAALSG